jgi:hypothetical protein
MLDLRHPKSCSSSISSEDDTERLLEHSMESLALERTESIQSFGSCAAFSAVCCSEAKKILTEDNSRIQNLLSMISQGKFQNSPLCKVRRSFFALLTGVLII